MTEHLARPVLDRIRRYAKEGRELRVRYGPGDCLLLALKDGQHPVVILRATRGQFTEMRGAAVLHWVRAEHPQKRFPRMNPRVRGTVSQRGAVLNWLSERLAQN